MENQTELKWYQKPTGVIILLIVFFPVGLYLMWKNDMWTKKTRWIVTTVIAVVLLANSNEGGLGGRSEPTGFYYGGRNFDPDEFYYEFKGGGAISICRGTLYDKNCCSDGSWSMNGKSVVISGISNSNCPEMSSLNGTYAACDEPDCIPSGKAFKKGEITIWPDKK